MGVIRVLAAGAQSTLQDRGRFGYQRFGVPVNGAMDDDAHCRANILVGNPIEVATLECTLVGPTLAFRFECLIALTGADLEAQIDGRPVPRDCAVFVGRGAVLTMKAARQGARAYLAIRGGFEVPEIMGSASTYLKGAFGGFEGRALRKGDELVARDADSGYPGLMRLRVQAHLPFTPGPSVASPAARQLSDGVRFIAGPQWDAFEASAQETFLSEPFTVDPNSDRMGMRLRVSPSLTLKAPLEMVSEATVFGTVQVPPDGQPIILLADRQSAGGYPKIAYVYSVDLPLLAQAKPGDEIRFVRGELAQAQAELVQRWHRFETMAATVAKLMGVTVDTDNDPAE